MTNICLYFQLHQPLRLIDYSFFNIGKNHFYENAALNQAVLNKVSEKCYLKANNILLKLIEQHKGRFKVAFSLSGILLEQLQRNRPEVIASFQALAKTGCVEFLAETYYHSLSSIYSKEEFRFQVRKHEKAIFELFGQKPSVFRNTELIYSDGLAKEIELMGYKGVLCEGVDRLLKGRSPHVLYKAPETQHIKCFLRDYTLSDDIAFRYSDKNWKEYPLTTEKYLRWLNEATAGAEVINLFMDYETFGEHQSEESGILKFMEQFPSMLLENSNFCFKTPSALVDELQSYDTYSSEEYISWADTERDLSAWLSNSMQYEALTKIYAMRALVLETKDNDLIDTWSKLQTSDHFYYMCTKYWADGDVHKYFSPYNSPYDAYIFYMNILSDFEITVKKHYKK